MSRIYLYGAQSLYDQKLYIFQVEHISNNIFHKLFYFLNFRDAHNYFKELVNHEMKTEYEAAKERGREEINIKTAYLTQRERNLIRADNDEKLSVHYEKHLFTFIKSLYSRYLYSANDMTDKKIDNIYKLLNNFLIAFDNAKKQNDLDNFITKAAIKKHYEKFIYLLNINKESEKIIEMISVACLDEKNVA